VHLQDSVHLQDKMYPWTSDWTDGSGQHRFAAAVKSLWWNEWAYGLICTIDRPAV